MPSGGVHPNALANVTVKSGPPQGHPNKTAVISAYMSAKRPFSRRHADVPPFA
jgi:hypothetical protein